LIRLGTKHFVQSLSFVAKSKGVFYLERQHPAGNERISANKNVTPQKAFADSDDGVSLEILC